MRSSTGLAGLRLGKVSLGLLGENQLVGGRYPQLVALAVVADPALAVGRHQLLAVDAVLVVWRHRLGGLCCRRLWCGSFAHVAHGDSGWETKPSRSMPAVLTVAMARATRR